MYFMKMTDRINSSNYEHLVHKSANYSVSTRSITQRSAVLSMRQTLVSQPCCWGALRSPWGLRFTSIPGGRAEVLGCCRSWQVYLLRAHLCFCHHRGEAAGAVYAWMAGRDTGPAWVLCSGCDAASHFWSPTSGDAFSGWGNNFKHSQLVKDGGLLLRIIWTGFQRPGHVVHVRPTGFLFTKLQQNGRSPPDIIMTEKTDI